MGRNSIIAIAGNETTDAANSIANRDRRRSQIQHPKTAGFRLAPLPQKYGDAGKQTTKPGESGTIKKDQSRLVHEQRRIFEDMPQLGTGYTAHGGVSSHADGVCVDAVTLEIAVECPAGKDGRQPQAQAKGADGEVSYVNEGVHENVSSL
jgi:hypothetical protein